MKKIIKYIPIILLILHCGLIFFFSAQCKESSNKASKGFVDVVEEVTVEQGQEVSEEQHEQILLVVRKSAHFVLFLVLGIYAYLSAESLKLKRKLVYALLFCLIYAASDEIHQIFVPGRSGEVRDAFIDLCGSVIGISATASIKRKFRKEG